MRFEKLSHNAQCNVLEAVHNALNNALFDSALSRGVSVYRCTYPRPSNVLVIDVVGDCYETCGNFRHQDIGFGDELTIAFQLAYIQEDLKRLRNIQAQKRDIVKVMLHEMVHQFLYEVERDVWCGCVQGTGEHTQHFYEIEQARRDKAFDICKHIAFKEV